MLAMTYSDSNTLAQCAQRLSLAAQLPVQLVASIDSTNNALLEEAAYLPIHSRPPRALMALHQTAGRGRRGRDWSNAEQATKTPMSPAFLASLGTRTLALLPTMGLLPLHIGVAVVEQLQAWGCAAQLKWPNDIVIQTPQGSAKLGGILVETRTVDGYTAVVLGMGLNWHSAPHFIDRQTACVAPLAHPAPDSETVAAALLAAMHLAWQRTVEQLPCNFAPHDALYGQTINAHNSDGSVVEGIAQGINPHGHLGMRTSTGLTWLHSGEVSMRAAL
jgi:biotin-[acetyl-CoA-carboxylase] ligase BirA-like protein